MLSRQSHDITIVGDVGIDTKHSCDQQLGSSTQDPVKPASFTHDPGGRKTWIFHLKNLIEQPITRS